MKEWVNNLLNHSGAPPELWSLALQYVCFLRNRLAHKSLGWRTPTEWLFGFTPDISVLLQFIFYEPVCHKRRNPSFPGDIEEAVGRMVEVSEHVLQCSRGSVGKVQFNPELELAYAPIDQTRREPPSRSMALFLILYLAHCFMTNYLCIDL